MTEFVTIRPAVRPDGKLHRIPMPSGYGLPGFGKPLPKEGFRVPLDHFVRRLLADKDAELVPAAELAKRAELAKAAAEQAAAEAAKRAVEQAATEAAVPDAEAQPKPDEPAQSGDAT